MNANNSELGRRIRDMGLVPGQKIIVQGRAPRYDPVSRLKKKQGTCKSDSGKFEIVDLHGTYSLTAYSNEEVVARDYLVNERPPGACLRKE